MALVLALSLLSGGVLGSITVCDPSNVIPPVEWASDNALSANYNIPFVSTQPSPRESVVQFYCLKAKRQDRLANIKN